MDNSELKMILSTLENLSNEELQKVADKIARVVIDRKGIRKKELWNNVVAAMTQYEKEIGEIIIFSSPPDTPDSEEWAATYPGIIDIK